MSRPVGRRCAGNCLWLRDSRCRDMRCSRHRHRKNSRRDLPTDCSGTCRRSHGEPVDTTRCCCRRGCAEDLAGLRHLNDQGFDLVRREKICRCRRSGLVWRRYPGADLVDGGRGGGGSVRPRAHRCLDDDVVLDACLVVAAPSKRLVFVGELQGAECHRIAVKRTRGQDFPVRGIIFGCDRVGMQWPRVRTLCGRSRWLCRKFRKSRNSAKTSRSGCHLWTPDSGLIGKR